MVAAPYEPMGKFDSTRWALVDQAREHDAVSKREAIGQLLAQYHSALRAHLIHSKRLPPERADDILQEFVVGKIIEQDILARADRQLGKFRTFLLTALDRFLLNRIRDENAEKRRPNEGALQIGGDWAESVPCDAGASQAFDVAWARGVIFEALKQMRVECETSGRTDVWGVFECRVLGPILEGAEPVHYRDLVERFGFQSPSQAANVLTTAKRMYARMLRSVVRQYARDDQEVDAEIAELQEILARSGA